MPTKRKPSKVIVVDFGRELFKSRAWVSLSGKSTQVFMLFLTKRKMATIKPKGQKKVICENCSILEFTYLEANRYGITRGQFTRAIDQLIEHGFLSVTETGGACKGDKSLYALIYNWRKYGKSSFEPGRAREPDPVQRGYRKPKELRAVKS